MNVRELIAELQRFPGDLPVLVADAHGEAVVADSVSQNIELISIFPTRKTAVVVSIDGTEPLFVELKKARR